MWTDRGGGQRWRATPSRPPIGPETQKVEGRDELIQRRESQITNKQFPVEHKQQQHVCGLVLGVAGLELKWLCKNKRGRQSMLGMTPVLIPRPLLPEMESITPQRRSSLLFGLKPEMYETAGSVFMEER